MITSNADDEGPRKLGSHVPRQRWIEIPAPKKVAEVYRLAWRGKTQSDVAKRYGIRQPLISELLRGKLKRIDPDTFAKLRRAAGKWWAYVGPLLLSKEATGYLGGYRDWMMHQESSAEATLGLSCDERRKLRRLRRIPKLKRALAALDKTFEKRGCPLRRRLMAFRSVLEPLNRYYTTDGMEVGFDDLTDRELLDFVFWGVKREELLVRKRDSEERRAQQAAESVEEREGELECRDVGVSNPVFSWDFMRASRIDAEATQLKTGVAEPKVEEEGEEP